ncbi:MAG: pyridoxal-5'-phosphate-dependent protein subunit beta [Thermoanaerobaculia bacterium]|nr:pyridoxal-5'-phosphate-dependent protein subunit beta [Thermoanaerobaculia bacterium]
MPHLGLGTEIIDQATYANSVRRFSEAKIALPKFSQLADPSTIPAEITAQLASVDPQSAHPLNLFRVHWFNERRGRERGSLPVHVVLPESLTGVKAKIVVLFGKPFPMITAHKVLAAYGCLAPRIVTGQFDPTRHRAVWPSTGNYCRGGVAISRIMQCRGVAVLPAGMSRERFAWLERWVTEPADIIRTPGTESNVKEIYDKCHELDADPSNIIFNQFAEFANYLVHYACTGRAGATVFEAMQKANPELRLRGFVSATGSAGTIAAGDYLKDKHGAAIVAAEALECPTMLANGFGEHNIQGIGDKHIPLIHNVMNTDYVVAISDRSTDALNALFNTNEGKRYLDGRRGVPAEIVQQLPHMGFSSICNILGAIKVAKYADMGPDDVIVTVATDGAELYATELEKCLARDFAGGFDEVSAGETFGQHMLGTGTDNMLELSLHDRRRIFDLGYYTWVEQQGVSFHDFVERRDQKFWRNLQHLIPAWDAMIDEFNAKTGA